MELEEAIKILKKDLESTKKANECGLATKGEFNKEIEAIEFVLNHLTKQQKIINQMAEDRMLPQGCRTLYNIFNKQDVIDFYEKFVEEGE